MTGDSKKPADGLMPIGRRSLLALMAGTAGVSLSEFTQAIGGSDGLGAIFAGTAALSQSYNVAGDLYVGPDSTKSSVAANNGRMFFASDTQEVFYGDSGTWTSLGTIGGGAGALSDSGTNNADGGDEYTLPAAEDSIDLQGTGDISDAATIVQGGSSTKADELTSRKHNDTINLKKWRDDNGLGDFGAAFNDAISWLSTNHGGGRVYVPPGSYSIDTRILWTTDNITSSDQIILEGAGRGVVDISTSVTDRPIIIGNLNKNGAPIIRDLRFDIRGVGTSNKFLMLGDDSGTHTADTAGPSFPRLENVNAQGGAEQIFYHMQNSFWIQVINCWIQNAKCLIGVSGQNWGNSGVHILAHYEMGGTGAEDDEAVTIQGAAQNHIFENCKMSAQTRSATLGGGGGHVVTHLDQEGSGGGVRTSTATHGNVYIALTSVGGVEPSSEDVLINCDRSGVTTFPVKGNIIGNYGAGFNDWPSGAGPGQRGQNTGVQELRQIYDGAWAKVNQQIHSEFEMGLPDGWTDQSTGAGAISQTGDPGGAALFNAGSTSTGDTAQADFAGNRIVKLNRIPIVHFQFHPENTADVVYRLGIENSAGEIIGVRFDTNVPDTNWQLWSEPNGSTQDTGFAPSAGTEVDLFIAGVTDESGLDTVDRISTRLVQGGNNDNRRWNLGTSASNDWQPVIYCETESTSADRQLTVTRWGMGQRNTAAAGP